MHPAHFRLTHKIVLEHPHLFYKSYAQTLRSHPRIRRQVRATIQKINEPANQHCVFNGSQGVKIDLCGTSSKLPYMLRQYDATN